MHKEKKKYLNRYLLQEAKINRLKEMARISPVKQSKYNAGIVKALALREEIEEKIKAVDDELLCELLFQKYIFGKTLEEIGLTLNYSERHIGRLHAKALEKFKM